MYACFESWRILVFNRGKLSINTCMAVNLTSHLNGRNCFRSSSHFVSISMALFWIIDRSSSIIISSSSIDDCEAHRQDKQNNYECTIDHELPDMLYCRSRALFMRTHQMAALFSLIWRHGRHLEIMTPYQKSDAVNRCVMIWGTCQISSRSDLKLRSLRILWKRSPQQEQEQQDE